VSYLINDIFYTLQGEGYWTGRAAVFVRFAKCNLWTGREEDRANAVCTFCDTDFTKGTRMTLEELLEAVDNHPFPSGESMVVLTGGEPLLQVDNELLEGLNRFGFYVAVETNGTQPVPAGIDWVCVSPKTLQLEAERADELKFVYPQILNPKSFQHFNATHFWLSPMDGPDIEANTRATVDYCLQNPQWRFNLQTHKTIGVK
jgi:7-carboxy-7-deazaguanine synthase (Cx14CxxC type)